MSLLDLVRIGNYATADEAFAAITTPAETRNAKAWTVADLAPLFPAEINTILGTLKSVPVFESAFIALSITGLELASNGRQAFIDQVAAVGQWSDDLKTKVKRLGRPLLAPWQSAGISNPTLSEVEAAFAVVQAELAKEAIKARLDALYNQIGTSEEAEAIAELRAITDELEG